MQRLIDAEETIRSVVMESAENRWNIEATAGAIALIENMPTIEKRKKGEWVLCDNGSYCYMCSVCGKHYYGSYSEIFTGEYRFCPGCGAEMKESQ